MGNGLSTSLRGAIEAPRQSIFSTLWPRWIASLSARNDEEESGLPSAFYFRWVSALIGMVLLASVPCYAQESASPAQPDMMQQLQKVMGKKNSKDKLGQALVIGSLLGCTQKTAGKEATQEFYHRMVAVGKTAESYCKQGYATEARALLVSTFQTNKDHAVVKSALGCYDAQTESIAALGGEKMAADAANYAMWMRDPALAEKELTEADVCRKTLKNQRQAAVQPSSN